MRRHRLLLASVFGCAFISGCMQDNYTSPPAPGVARLQKSDPPAKPTRGTNLLDSLPEQVGDAAEGTVAARIRATVNGTPIFDEEVQANAFQIFRAIEQLPEPERSQKRREVYKDTLDQLVERELLIQDATARLKKAGDSVMQKLQEAADKEFDKRWVRSMKAANKMIKTDDDLRDMLKGQGLSLEMVKRQWTRQFIATEYLRNRVFGMLDRIGHEQIKEYYEEHIQEFLVEDTVEWQDVFISATNGKYKTREEARKVAEDIRKRAKAGENFLSMCKQFDDGTASGDDGNGIGKKRGEIQPVDCEEHLFGMQPGDVGPIIELGTGFHVFRLVTRVFAGRKPFDIEVQKDIRNKLRSDMYEREVKKISADLKRKAVIEYARASR